MKRQLEQAQGELLSARKGEESAKAKSATDIAELQKKLSEKSSEVDALQRQVRDTSRAQAQDEDPSAVAKDLMSAAKTTALEAANVELTNEVKQLRAQLEAARAAGAGGAGHDSSAGVAAVASRFVLVF